MNSKKLIRKLWNKFPIKIAKKYHDFVGKMVGSIHEDTSRIVLCLDVTPNVILKAKEFNADLIISHHPFIYGKKKLVLLNPYKKKMYDELETENIPVYSFHTNFDEGVDGMNDALAQKLNLNNIRVIPNVEIGRMGELPHEMDIVDFAHYATKVLNLKYSQLIAGKKTSIKTVGIVGGSSARDVFLAIESGCDIFLSGDTPYHIRREVRDRELNYLHIDHEVEQIFMPTMKRILKSFDESLQIEIVNDVSQSELIIVD